MQQRVTHRMALKNRMLVPNLGYLAILVAIGILFAASRTLVSNLQSEHKVLAETATSLQDLENEMRDFLAGGAYSEVLKQHCDTLVGRTKDMGFSADLQSLSEYITKIRDLRTNTTGINEEFTKVTDLSIEQSNTYIKQTSELLADPAKEKEVSTLQRLVLGGACVNTTVTFQLKLMYGQLANNEKAGEETLKFVETLLTNVEHDVERLKGTPFQGMAEKARESNRRAKDLIESHTKNLKDELADEGKINDILKKSIVAVNGLVEARTQDMVSKITLYLTILMVVVGVTTALGILLSIWQVRSLSSELSWIASSLGESSEQTRSAASQVAGSSTAMAEGASNQASSLEETSASLQQMTSMTKQNADDASQAMRLMTQAKEVIGTMARSTQEMQSAISEIKTSADQTAKIVKTIDEIAFQTNLLALNAAVEAARAGDAGKGFAVVAEEVRNLAQRSAEAAKNTAVMIEGSVKNADNGVQVAQRVSESLEQTVQNTGKVAQLISAIAEANKDQAQGIEQINRAVTQMDQVTQANAANSEESASASEELTAQAEEMNRMVRELIAMVTGGSAEADNRRPRSSPKLKPPTSGNASDRRQRPIAALGHSSNKALTHPTSTPQRVVNAEQIIPLNDDDLDEMS